MGSALRTFILKPTIAAIYDILHMENCRVSGVDGVPAENKLTLNPSHFDLEFDDTYRAVHPGVMLDYLPELTVQTNKANYKIPRNSANYEGRIMMGGGEKQHFDLRFRKLTQDTIQNGHRYYWRFLYPVDSSEWFLKIQALPYTDDFGMSHYRNLITTELDDPQMSLYSESVDSIHWMIIESSDAITYEEMDHRVMVLTTSLGFVVGKRYGDYCFHVASEVQDFSIVTGVEALALQKTKFCPFKVLHNNNAVVEDWLSQFECQKYALEELKSQHQGNVRWYYNEDSTVTIGAFGKLSQLCYKTNDMLLATSMLIDGSLMNIEYQKPIFYVALETITSALMKDVKISMPPVIPQGEYKEKVAPVLVEALHSITGLSEEAVRVFTNRINSNLNAAPNANKLEACFPKYGYQLTETDKKAIDKRNSTFHGHLTSEHKPLREQQDELLGMSLRLHKLCSILLLKAAGFTGKIVNNEVMFGLKEACERKESVYIEI